MPSRRIQRLNEQLRREISEIVRWNVKDPRVGPAAISRVETSSDLSHAKVWVVVLTGDVDIQDTLAGLRAAGAFIRSQLSQRVEIRKVPALDFRADRSMAHAAHIEKLLGQVQPAPADYSEDWEQEPEPEEEFADDDLDEDALDEDALDEDAFDEDRMDDEAPAPGPEAAPEDKA